MIDTKKRFVYRHRDTYNIATILARIIFRHIYKLVNHSLGVKIVSLSGLFLFIAINSEGAPPFFLAH